MKCLFRQNLIACGVRLLSLLLFFRWVLEVCWSKLLASCKNVNGYFAFELFSTNVTPVLGKPRVMLSWCLLRGKWSGFEKALKSLNKILGCLNAINS